MKILSLRDKRGSLLLICYIVIIVFAILGSAFLIRSVGEKNIAQRNRLSLQAFSLAQAGIMRALYELRINFNWPGTTVGSDAALEPGQYRVTSNVLGDRRQVIATGFVPNSGSANAQRAIEVFVESEDFPANFFLNALYVSGDATFNGNAYVVDGNVLYADDVKGDDPANITGTVTQDPSITPLLRLDFKQLREMSAAQGNIFDAFRLKTDSLPGSFWYTRADDGLDDDANGTIDNPEEWVPNIVYIEADLVVKGNIGTIGGFLVVVGDVITDPFHTSDTTINGCGVVDGCIYTTGEFTVNGGGGVLNVSGGVWAGLEATINGNVDIEYNAEYMAAIDSLPLSPDLQILSWREL